MSNPESKKEKDKKKKTKALQEQLDASKQKTEELEDRLLRLAAEYDNYRKRTAREFEQLVRTANENLILQLVDVLDNFERALHSAKNAKDLNAFHQGVELIYQNLQELLARAGLKNIDAVGKPFDPHLHEAIMQIEDGEHPPETVVNEIQRGYTLGEKLLRASRVVVSKTPPEVPVKVKRKAARGKKSRSMNKGGITR
jgi:molecular chaperone GrpE